MARDRRPRLTIDGFPTIPPARSGADPSRVAAGAREDTAIPVASALGPEGWHARAGDCLDADTTIRRLASAAEFEDVDGPSMRECLVERRRAEDRRW